jgi:hypothetical protein
MKRDRSLCAINGVRCVKRGFRFSTIHVTHISDFKIILSPEGVIDVHTPTERVNFFNMKMLKQSKSKP